MSDINLIDCLPVEILLKLFTNISTKDLIRCRAVSNRWKDIIDGITSCENFWRKRCIREYADVYRNAWRKRRKGMVFSDIYRSLSLWSRLAEANEEQDEFCSASSVAEEIRSITILPNGTIGVHKRSTVMYYDVETWRPASRKSLRGDYLRYSENDVMIILHGFHLHLTLKRKLSYNRRDVMNATYDEVKTYIHLDDCTYFIDMNDNLNFVSFDDYRLQRQLLCKCNEGIMAMGYKDGQLRVLTYQRKIYKLVDNKLTFVLLLGPTMNLLHQLKQHNLLDLLDWRIYFQWMFVLNHNVPPGPLQDIVTTKTYGDVVFTGSNWGVLRIYYQPFSLGEFDLFNAEPIKQYNFMERYDCPVLSMCPILCIDVLEVDDGHIVIVAMPKKIAVLSFMHNFLKTRGALLRCNVPKPADLLEQIEGMKIITIE